MKKILIIHHYGSIGGAGVSLLHIVKSIDKKKFAVTVLCPEHPNEMIELLRKEECEVIGTSTSPKMFAHYNGGIPYAISIKTLKNILAIKRDEKHIEQYIREINPDIVAVNSMTLFWIGKIAKNMNKKTVCFHRETYQKGILGIRTKIIKQGLSKWFDEVAFISRYDLDETGNINAMKKVIYDRVDISSFNKYEKSEARQILGLEQNGKYVLYLGGMSALKGSDVLMDAFKYITDDNIKLIFINETDWVQKPTYSQAATMKERLKFILKLEIQQKTLGIYFKERLNDKIIFKKTTSSPELYYKACDLVVFPSTKAHQSRPIYEAGITKIPILITQFQNTNEFAQDGVTAITFKNKDCYDLAKKINMVMKGEINTDKIIENNYKQTVLKHDLCTLQNDLDDLFVFD